MSLISELVTIMTAAGITAYYPEAVPEDIDLPFVVYRILNKDPLTTLNNSEDMNRFTMSFESYGASLAAAQTLSNSVKTAIEASGLIFYRESQPGEEYIQLIDGYMEPLFYGIWHS